MKDLKGKQFNSWIVIKEVNRDIHNKRVWECSCKCGDIYNIIQENLTRSKSKMCRKCSLEQRKELPKRENHRLYSIWKNMRSRCTNPNRQHYHNYGGRGIKVCDRWDDFLLFLEDMEHSFIEGLTLDRMDVDGDYTPKNCRWATIEEQANNKQDSLKLLFEGEYYTEAQLSRKTGVSRTTIQQRRKNGYSIEEMIYGRKGVGKFELEYNGGIYSGKELAELLGIEAGTLRYRVRQGWSMDEVINGR
jgi:biotin operon repressor